MTINRIKSDSAHEARTEPKFVRYTLIGIAVTFLTIFVVLPLLVEILYNEYQFVASFAIASLLAFLALVTLIVKTVLESRLEQGQLASDD